MTEQMTILVLQLGIIIFAARGGGILFEKLRMPAIIGELTAGIIIGPYLLGGINLPILNQPLFTAGETFPVSPQLYGFATVASVILLFLIGLQTDLKTLLKYSITGSLVGAGGVIVPFFFGNLTAVFLSEYLFGVQYGPAHPIPLILGVIASTTSVGITAQILSEKRKMHSPEGATIISGAVVNDVLSIIALAVIIALTQSGNIRWQEATRIAVQSILIWIAFTAFALIFSKQISSFLKRYKDTTTITIMGLGMALILAGIFEKAGLAIIIGAYVMGLSFSKTDLDYVMQEKLTSLYKFFVPIFFCVMGMKINLGIFASGPVLVFGFAYTFAAIAAKIIGSGLPPLFLNFNLRGASQIGFGLAPRGEVTLIIAGIGLSVGLLNQEAFSAVAMMTVITALIIPGFFSLLLQSNKPVLRKKLKPESEKTKHIQLKMPSSTTLDLILSKIVASFRNEGFYVNRVETGRRREKLFQVRKNQTFITMKATYNLIEFSCKAKDSIFINTLAYETICDLENTMHQLQKTIDSKALGKKIFAKETTTISLENKMINIISPEAVKVNLQSWDKKSAIEEMVELIIESGQLPKEKRNDIIKALLEREETMSTGMEYGIAIPHIKTDTVNSIVCALGIKKEGIDFQSLDNKKSKIFVMILSPSEAIAPHIKFMADVTQLLTDPHRRQELLNAKSNKELFKAFTKNNI